MKIELYPPLSIHEIGQRDNQEDSIAQWDNRLFVLCDGMGGHEKGEVASQTVCQSLVKWFQENITNDSFTDDQLRAVIEFAYTELDKFDDDSPKKMGTTLTLLYIHNKGITAVHMGDSRIYHIRPYSPHKLGGARGGLNEGILYQSRDHSLVFDLLQAGEISYDEIATFPQKNIVTRALTPGEDNRMRPDIIHITDIQPGDYFYMCSDGMLELMSNNELVALLSSDVSDEEKRQQLIAATANNQDNHTAWLIHVEGIILEEGDEQLTNEEPTARCNAINIIPQSVPETDDDADVVIVSKPPVQPIKRNNWVRIGLLLLAAIFALILLWAFFFQSKEKPELQRPKPMMQTPIPPRHKDSKNSNTNQSRKNESAGNQQPVNAQSRNDSTWHLQNR